MRLLILSTVVFLVACSHAPSKSVSIEDSISTFQKIAVECASNKVVCVQEKSAISDLSKIIANYLSEKGIQYDLRNEGVFTIALTGTSELNKFANNLYSESGTQLIYDLNYLFENSWSAASFDRDKSILFVPHSTIETLDVTDLTLRHEIVHVNVFKKLTSKEESPYHGFLKGSIFEPSRLDLDEMKAYDHDLRLALELLKEFLNKSVSKIDIKDTKAVEILEVRMKDMPTLKALTPFEVKWDGFVKKIIHGRNHTEPVIQTLNLAYKYKNISPEYSLKYGQVLGTLRFTDGNNKYEISLFLTKSKGLKDESNKAYFNEKISLLSTIAFKHKNIWDSSEKIVRKSLIDPGNFETRVEGMEIPGL